jgi:hypothetical protein
MTIHQLNRNARRAALGRPKHARKMLDYARRLSELKRPAVSQTMTKKQQRVHGLLPALASFLILAIAGCAATKPAPPAPVIMARARIESTNAPFLVLSNRTWIDLNGFIILRVSDGEWNILTNTYPTNLSTQTIRFVK